MLVGQASCLRATAARFFLKLSSQQSPRYLWIGCADSRVHARHRDCVPAGSGEDTVTSLCELNVLEQVMNVVRTGIVQEAWARGQAVEVHGWIYGLRDGLLKDLGLSVTEAAALESSYAAAVARLRG